MADDEPPPPPPTLESMFEAFSQFGPLAVKDEETILLSQCDTWMRQSKLFTKEFTLTETGMIYNRFKCVQAV